MLSRTAFRTVERAVERIAARLRAKALELREVVQAYDDARRPPGSGRLHLCTADPRNAEYVYHRCVAAPAHFDSILRARGAGVGRLRRIGWLCGVVLHRLVRLFLRDVDPPAA